MYCSVHYIVKDGYHNPKLYSFYHTQKNCCKTGQYATDQVILCQKMALCCKMYAKLGRECFKLLEWFFQCVNKSSWKVIEIVLQSSSIFSLSKILYKIQKTYNHSGSSLADAYIDLTRRQNVTLVAFINRLYRHINEETCTKITHKQLYGYM